MLVPGILRLTPDGMLVPEVGRRQMVAIGLMAYPTLYDQMAFSMTCHGKCGPIGWIR